jgi:hypothetical protein
MNWSTVSEFGPLSGAITFLIVSMIGFLYIAIYYLSKKDIFVSPRIKGEIKVATLSEAPWKFFGSVPPGKYLDWSGVVKEGERHIDPETGIMRPGKEKRTLLNKLFRVERIGMPPYGGIHEWKISFSKWVQVDDGSNKLEVVLNRPEKSLHIMPTFAFRVFGAETLDKYCLDIDGKYTLSLIDAMRALFTTKNWRMNIEAAIIAAICDFVKVRTYDQFFAKPFELDNAPALGISNNSGFVKEIMTINTDTNGNDSILRYGFILSDINVTSVKLSGSNDPSVVAATTALGVATKNAEALRAKSEGEKDAAINQAKGLEAICKALGQNSNQIGLLKIAEAIAKHQAPLALGGAVLPTMDMSGSGNKGTGATP